MKLILATKNKGKVEELKELLRGLRIDVTSLFDRPEIPDVEEDGETFLENARKKAHTAAQLTKMYALADDSGLVVDALGGAPGVRSARYAGKQGDYKANNEKLLIEMKDVPDEKRGAAFVCWVVLAAPDGREWTAEGRCEGVIGREFAGSGGFGFDPLFFVPAEGLTMAELPMARKNQISHRGWALKAIHHILVEILSETGEL